jgi:hypothetical protein
MTNKTKTSFWMIMAFTVPFSVFYLVMFNNESIVCNALSFVLLGFAFGLIQSLFDVNRPNLVAFISTSLIPILAYITYTIIVLTSTFGFVFFKWTDSPLFGGPSPQLSFDLNNVGGTLKGILLFWLTVTILGLLVIIPFGIIGLSGRIAGDKLFPWIFSTNRFSYKKIGNGILLEDKHADKHSNSDITAKATIVAAIIAAVASVLVAFITHIADLDIP